MSYADTISKKLTIALDPVRLSVVDESHKHAGHAGAHPAGESHFYVEIVSGAFEGLSRIDRHKRVYEILKDELATHVHALRLKTLTVDEDVKQP